MLLEVNLHEKDCNDAKVMGSIRVCTTMQEDLQKETQAQY